MLQTNQRTVSAAGCALVFATFLSTFLAFARVVLAEPAWVSIGPDGGDQFAIEISPTDPNTMFALSFVAVYRTTDRAATWTPIHEPAMRTGLLALAFDPLDSSHIYLATGTAGVFESNDLGETWTNCTVGIPAQPAKPSLLYPIVSLVSLANGDLLAGMSQVAGEVDPPAFINRTTDGCTWAADNLGIAATATGVTQKVAALLSLDANDQPWAMVHGAGVYRYQTGAWVVKNGNLPAAAVQATFLAHDPLNANRLLLGTESDWIYESVNAGVTWSALPLPVALQLVAPLPLVYDIAIDPSNVDFVYALANDASTAGETPIFTASLLQAGGGGGYLTANGGTDWPLVPAPLFPRVRIDSSTTVSTDLWPFGVTTRSKDWFATSYGDANLLSSVDGLESVEASNAGLTSVLVNTLWLHPDPVAPNDKMLFTGAEEGIRLRIDDGPGWVFQQAAPTTIYTWSLANDPADPTLVYYGTGQPARLNTLDRGIYRMDLDCFGEGCPAAEHLLADVGVWKVITTPLQPLAVYAATQDVGVMKSIDRGETWTPMNPGLTLPKSITDIALDTSGNPLLASARTNNGDITADPPQPWLPDATEPGALYRFGGGVWTASPDISAAVYGLAPDAANPLHFLAATAQGVYETQDGGVAWTEIDGPLPATDVLIDPLKPGYFYAASQQGVRRSTNAGAEWHPLTLDLHQPSVLTLDIDAGDGTLYAGTLGGSAFQLTPDPHPEPVVSVEPASLSFEVTPTGFTLDLPATLTNGGEADLSITSITSGHSAFSVVGPALPITLTPLSSTTLSVRFGPQAAGSFATSLTIGSNDPTAPAFAYPVDGVGRDALVPTVDVRIAGSDGPVSVPHGGSFAYTADLTEGDFSQLDADFWVRWVRPDGVTLWLAEGASFIASVTPIRFRTGPIVSLSPYFQTNLSSQVSGNHVLSFLVDDNADGVFDGTWSDSAALTVEPKPPAVLTSLTQLAFGKVALGSSAGLGFGIINTGGLDLVVTAIDLPIPQLEFIAPAPVFPLTVRVGTPKVVLVRFRPTAQVLYATELAIHSNDPATPILELPVTGQGGTANLPTPTLLLNGAAGPWTVTASDPATFSANLAAGDFTGQSADFWVRQTLPDASTRWLVAGSGWVTSATPVRFLNTTIASQTPSFTVPLSNTSEGVHDLYFAVDANADGVFDGTWFDEETMTAVPEPNELAMLAAGGTLVAALARRRRRMRAVRPTA